MKPIKLLAASILFISFSFTYAIPDNTRLEPNDEGPWVVRVYEIDDQDYSRLQQQFDVWAIDSNDAYAIIGIKSRNEMKLLRGLGFPVLIDPVQSAKYRQPAISKGLNAKTIPGFACYRTVEETQMTAEQIVQNNPDLAELIDVGDSWEKTEDGTSGFDLNVLKLTNQNITGVKPKLFVMSAIHAREYTTAETMTRFAEQLANGYDQNADITWLLDHHEVHLLLQSNPDGRKQAETGLLWRKNTNENYCSPVSQDRGADLNRNFPFQWGGAASTDPCNPTYQGPSANSEPEVNAVVDYVRSIFPDQRGDLITDAAALDATGVFIDIHSFSQLVLWPWGFSNAAGPAPNQDQLSTLGRRLAFFNSYRPQQILGLTAASGSTADFAYGELGVAAYAYELGTSFFQDCSFFENNIADQNIASMMYAAKVARTPYQTPSGPDVDEPIISPNTLLPGENINLLVRADGTRFSTLAEPTSPQEAPRVISNVEIFLDNLPWASSATANATPSDGSFDSSLEDATATLSTTGLTQGRYTVFAQAVGQDNQAGAISSEFVFILDPATSGRLFGQVLVDGTTTSVPDALIQTGSFQTMSDASGNYSINLPPGTYTLDISANGFGNNSAQVTIDPSEQEALNLTVLSRCELFADDIENGNIGWTADTPWAINSEQANSPTQSWHDSPGGPYQNGLNISLTSPLIDLSLATSTELNFAHVCDTESGFDFGIVEISTDGTNWSEVYRCDDQESFQNQSVNLDALDGSATAQFRFRLSTDNVVDDNGWYIDDVSVTGASPVCTPDSPDLVFSDGFE